MRKGWDHVQLGDLLVQVKEPVKVLPGVSYKLLGVRWYGNGPFIRETVTNETSKATRLFPVQPGDFIYNRLFAWKGSFGLITRELDGCFVSSEFPLFRVKQDRLDAALLNLIMCQPSKWAQIEIESTGSTSVSRNRWKEDRFLEQVLYLPPLEEQKRMVDVVSSVDAYIDALRQQADTARAARNAVLHELLSAGGDDWTKTTLGEIGASGFFSDGDWVESKDQDPEGDYRLLQLADIGDGVFLDKSSRWLNEEQFQRLRCTALASNDILIARMPDPIARACLFPDHLPVSATVVDVAILRCGPGQFPEFLVMLINDVTFRAAANSLITGTTRQRISRSNLSALTFALPPLAEQKRIVEIVSSMDDVIQSTEQAVTDAKNLRSGLLSDLLSGDHEIPATYDRLLKVA